MGKTDLQGMRSFNDLRGQLQGPILVPGDAEYEGARAIWNGLVDRRPGAVARCRSPDDVRAAVSFARENRLLLAVRGGGHDYGGNSVCEDGLVVDLSLMNEVRVDPEARRVRAGGGALVGQIDRATQEFGLATPTGTVSTIGIGGCALGGGTGYLSRKHGLVVDNLRSADVVTADGELIHASESENPDLFWALRGGGGNFGVVTSLELRLHDVGPEILAGQIIYPFDGAREVLRSFREFMGGAPDGVQCYPFFLKLPPLPVFPAELHGEVVIDLVVAYAGPVDEGQEALRPLRELGETILDAVQPQPYTQVQQAFDAGMPKGHRWYSKAHYLRGLPDEAIDEVLQRSERLPGPFTVVYFEPLGGAVGRVEPSATAFPHRDAPLGIHIFPGWSDPAMDGELEGWAREFHAAMTRYSTGGVYVNLLPPDAGPDEVRAAYGLNYERLARIKGKYDPGNLFRVNHNIEPAS